jgi:hypothetical protein
MPHESPDSYRDEREQQHDEHNIFVYHRLRGDAAEPENFSGHGERKKSGGVTPHGNSPVFAGGRARWKKAWINLTPVVSGY